MFGTSNIWCAGRAIGIVGGGSLRAAILGVNDGLVSNFSLVMGVAGGTGNADIILLAGVAGLLAGAFSMAAGEYVSVASEKDVSRHHSELLAKRNIDSHVKAENSLIATYLAKGLTLNEAEILAGQMTNERDGLLETNAHEEIAFVSNVTGPPWNAALSSFVAFVIGALIPITPYLFVSTPNMSLYLSAIFSAFALLSIGALVATNSGRNVIWGATKMFIAGGLAAAVTYAVGSAIGVAVTG